MPLPSFDRVPRPSILLAAVVLACQVLPLVAGCTNPDDVAPKLTGDDPPPCEVTTQSFVIDRIRLPRTPADSAASGLDLDGDPNSREDNRLGNDLVQMLSLYDAQPSLDATVAAAKLLWVVQLDRCTDGSPYARASVFQGAAIGDPAGIFGGQVAVFLVHDAKELPAVGETLNTGRISVTLGRGVLPFSAFVDTDSAEQKTIWQQGISMSLDLGIPTASGLDGHIGMAIPSVVPAYPGLARSLTAAIANGSKETADLFDTSHNGTVSLEELAASNVLKSLLSPDLDLEDCSQDPCVFWPRHDGIADNLSIGVAFHAVPATVVQ